MFTSAALIASIIKNARLQSQPKVDSELIQAATADLKKELDTASTAGSQTTIIDQETTILLQSRVKNIMDYLFSPDSQVRLVNNNHAIDYITFALSDTIFVYSGTYSRYHLGNEVIRNANGELVKVIEMETRTGALDVVQGFLANSSNNKVSVLTCSQALLAMIPNLHQLVLDRQPIVFHVSAQSVDENLVVSPHLEAVLAARHTGAIFLSSFNAQEAHDMAIAAHLIAHSVNLPVIHFFYGTTKEIQKVNFTPFKQLTKLTITASHSPYQAAKDILAQYNYKPFEYIGAKDAETVLVCFSASIAGLDQAVSRAALNTSVSLVSVRVFRPWSETDFIHALPSTTKRLVVLQDGGAGLYALNGPLYLDVVASIRFGPMARDKRPRLVSAQASFGFTHLDANHIPLLVKEAHHEKFIHLDTEPFSVSDVTMTLEKDEASWSAIFWDIDRDGTTPAAIHDAHLVQTMEPQTSVHARISCDTYHVGSAVTQTQLSYSSSCPHQYVGIHNINVIKEYNTLANVTNNATIVLHGPWKHGDEIEGILTNEFKFGLTQINAKLYTIDASRIAQELGLNIKSTHVVWEVVFLILGQKVDDITDRLAAFYYELPETENKETLTSLLSKIVSTVTNELVAIELLPPWTILEVNDIVLPTTPLDRLISADDDGDDNDASDITAIEEVDTTESGKWHKAAWQLMFNEAYKTKNAIRPDLHEKTYVIKVSENRRLTPDSYDRNVFHIEFDTIDSNLRYELGDALGVHGHNDYQQVQEFLDWYGLDGNNVISVKNTDKGIEQVRTIFQLFSQNLDIFGRPSKKFYETLAGFATEPKEREQLLYLISAEGKDDFKKRVDDTTTYEDLLREFTSAKPRVEILAQIVAPIKPRHYSIASSQKMYNNQVHLLVVAVDWMNSNGKQRYGQCTRYLSSLNVGDQVTVSIKPSVMKLPPLDSQPVIMAGLGTGMAPFRAFIQERYLAKLAGKNVGPVVLYFGSRHRSMEYLYGEELEAYATDGILSHMGLAFSRDQKEKVYIQHKMMQDAEILADYLLNKNGHFYLCGPTWPVPDVKDAVVYGLCNFGNIEATKASALIEEWKEKETYVLEVY